MKESTLHSIITAKSIFEEAHSLCSSGITHSATAGLILLQDALELILLASINELGLDESTKSEKMTFDQIIGTLQSASIRVPKSGTLKALNKHRVLAKHYGQLVLPETVRGYSEACETASDTVLQAVVGKRLKDIYLTDLLHDCEARSHLETALFLYKEGEFLEALISIRKAIFVEIECMYSVHEFAVTPNLFFFAFNGQHSPQYAKNKSWIEVNVKEPTDYIQIDYDRLKSQALEWGVNTTHLFNIFNLTPKVFRSSPVSEWCVSYPAGFIENYANQQNFEYCLDRAIAILTKKQTHARSLILPAFQEPFRAPTIYLGDQVFAHARTNSPVVHTIQEGYLYQINKILTGFDNVTKFYGIQGRPAGDPAWSSNSIYGFLIARPDAELMSSA